MFCNWVSVLMPVAGAGEALGPRVAASGVNRPDVLQRTRACTQRLPGASGYPGLEIAGVIGVG